ncbi:MAG: radical SAM family heme chaperone HemW [Deltaproteobacteria bacterium]|nr:radical SAM family heme chaperone HemW [Deltaproteobacteria bacterium]
MKSLYIHIPFCEVKCGYCDFFSVPRGHEEFDLQKEYTHQLIAEIHERAREFSREPIHSIFLGGGTPSLLHPKYLGSIFEALHQHFSWDASTEVTLEANPKTVSLERLRDFRSLGVNRLSVGVQSFQDKFLKVMGRIHSGEEAKKTVHEAREAGFHNMSIDLIYSLPGETLEDFELDLSQALSLETDHLSLYNLTIEQETPFEKMYRSGLLSLPSEEEQCRMFERVGELEGFHRYEISNFSRRGFECRHNLNYWDYGEFIGFGAGAVSFIRIPPGPPFSKWGVSEIPPFSKGGKGGFGLRHQNVRDLKKYLAGQWEQETEVIPLQTAMREFLMMGFRKMEGVSLKRFSELFGQSLEETFPDQLSFLSQGEWIEKRDQRVRLTTRGLPVANEILQRF